MASSSITSRCAASAISLILMATLLVFATPNPSDASVNCGRPTTIGCSGGGGGGTPTPEPVSPTPSNPGNGGGGGGSGGGGGITQTVIGGVVWFDQWYPGAPIASIPADLNPSPIYYQKYGACGSSGTQYGNWLGFTWTGLVRKKFGDVFMNYNCIPPPTFKLQKVKCPLKAEGSFRGPYRNANVDFTEFVEIDYLKRTGFNGGWEECQDTFMQILAEPTDWGLWELDLMVDFQICTAKIYTSVDARSGRVPAPEILDCGAVTQEQDSVVMASWCPTTPGGPADAYRTGVTAVNTPVFWPAEVRFNSNDCYTPERFDSCDVGWANQTTPEGRVVRHGNDQVVNVLANGDRHVFTWREPEVTVTDPLTSRKADLRNWQALTTRFELAKDSSPQLSARGSQPYDPDQPFTADPTLGRTHQGLRREVAIRWSEATQMADGTWQTTPRWYLEGEARLASMVPVAWDYVTDTLTTRLEYRWHETSHTCLGTPATVHLNRIVTEIR